MMNMIENDQQKSKLCEMMKNKESAEKSRELVNNDDE